MTVLLSILDKALKTLVGISFLKKLKLPGLDFSFKKLVTPASFVGIDIGISSAKVVQLREESEKAVLETYGELKTGGYFKKAEGGFEGGALRFLDSEIAGFVSDLLREANVTTKEAIFAIPAVSSFVTMIDLPKTTRQEVASAVPFEARKYIPIPISEVVLDWEIVLDDDSSDKTHVLILAVPKEVINKYKRVAEIAKLNIRALEVETFSMVRSLIGHDQKTFAIVNIGAQSTTVAIIDKAVVHLSVNISRGSSAISLSLSRGLGITFDRADDLKKETGLSERAEEKEISGIISPIVDSLFSEVERVINVYNRKNIRKIERIILTGGGANLKGLIDYSAKRFGLEAGVGNPFARVTYPAFMRPIIKEIESDFAVAIGCALREITPR